MIVFSAGFQGETTITWNRSARGSLLTSTIIYGIMMLAAPVAAQTTVSPGSSGEQTIDPAGPAAPNGQDDIVVTGSLIRNPALTGYAPVSVLGQNEVSLRQTNSAEELLKTLPGVTAGIGSAVSSNNPGAATVNLRGLGANRNLVLIDGNRIVPFGLIGATDLNNVPLALIQRTEVLTGGASTTYGADAISGVVNFITRNDFSGAEISTGTSVTERGDGPTYRADATLGANFDGGRGNAVISIGYQKVEPILRGDRSFSNSVTDSFTGLFSGSGTAVPARFTVAGTTLGTRQINPATGALVSTFSTYNFAPPGSLQLPFERFNAFGSGHYDVADGIQFYTRTLFSRNTVKTFLPPSGLSGTLPIPDGRRMSMLAFMHAAGVACLVGMAVAAIWTLINAIAPNRHRILAALRGKPVPPAASVAPTRPRNLTQLRCVEAAAEPTIQVQP